MNKNKQIILALAGVLVLYALLKALFVTDMLSPYWQVIMKYSLIITIGALGLSIIYGFTGQFSLGHAAFVGIGAYSAGLFAKAFSHYGILSFLGSLVVGMACAALVAYLIGLPVLRLKSDYLGIATLGFNFIVNSGFENADKLIPALGGAKGMTGIPQVQSFEWYFFLAVLVIIMVRNFVFSTHGRACTAIRENETAADVVGVSPAKAKITAFVFGCALAGLGGALYAHNYPFLHPSSFNFLVSIDYLIVVVLGGLGSITGTVVTAIGWAFLLEALRFVLGPFYDFRGVIYALLLVVIIIVRRQGIFGGMELPFMAPQVGRRKPHVTAGG